MTLTYNKHVKSLLLVRKRDFLELEIFAFELFGAVYDGYIPLRFVDVVDGQFLVDLEHVPLNHGSDLKHFSFFA